MIYRYVGIQMYLYHVSELPVELDEDGHDAVTVLGHRDWPLGWDVLHEELEEKEVSLEQISWD